MSDLVFRINAVRGQAEAASAKLGEGDATRKQLSALNGKADEIRKKIVATKEGGAITGEERLREHMDQLYGAIMSYDGKPSDYQLARIDALKRELDDVQKQFADFQQADLPKANDALKAAKLEAIAVPEHAPDDSTGSGAEGKKRYDEEEGRFGERD